MTKLYSKKDIITPLTLGSVSVGLAPAYFAHKISNFNSEELSLRKKLISYISPGILGLGITTMVGFLPENSYQNIQQKLELSDEVVLTYEETKKSPNQLYMEAQDTTLVRFRTHLTNEKLVRNTFGESEITYSNPKINIKTQKDSKSIKCTYTPEQISYTSPIGDELGQLEKAIISFTTKNSKATVIQKMRFSDFVEESCEQAYKRAINQEYVTSN